MGRYFCRFEGTHYVPNERLAMEYPNDEDACLEFLESLPNKRRRIKRNWDGIAGNSIKNFRILFCQKNGIGIVFNTTKIRIPERILSFCIPSTSGTEMALEYPNDSAAYLELIESLKLVSDYALKIED